MAIRCRVGPTRTSTEGDRAVWEWGISVVITWPIAICLASPRFIVIEVDAGHGDRQADAQMQDPHGAGQGAIGPSPGRGGAAVCTYGEQQHHQQQLQQQSSTGGRLGRATACSVQRAACVLSQWLSLWLADRLTTCLGSDELASVAQAQRDSVMGEVI